MVVDAPAGVPVEGPSHPAPPRVGAVHVRVQPAHHVDQRARRQDRPEPLALLRQESLRALAGAPVLDVQPGVGDVEVPHHEELPALRRGCPAGRRQVSREAPQEAHLALVLRSPVGLLAHPARLLQVRGQPALGEVEGRHRERLVREIDLHVTPLGGERLELPGERAGLGVLAQLDVAVAGCADEHARTPAPHGGRRLARQHGHAVAPGRLAGVIRQVVVTEDAVRQERDGAPDLLQRHDVAAARGEPVVEATTLRGPDPVDVEGGDAQHPPILVSRRRWVRRWTARAGAASCRSWT